MTNEDDDNQESGPDEATAAPDPPPTSDHDESDEVTGMSIGPALAKGIGDLAFGQPGRPKVGASLTEEELRRLGGK